MIYIICLFRLLPFDDFYIDLCQCCSLVTIVTRDGLVQIIGYFTKAVKNSATDNEFLRGVLFVHEILSFTLVLGNLRGWVGAKTYLEPS